MGSTCEKINPLVLFSFYNIIRHHSVVCLGGNSNGYGRNIAWKPHYISLTLTELKENIYEPLVKNCVNSKDRKK